MSKNDFRRVELCEPEITNVRDGFYMELGDRSIFIGYEELPAVVSILMRMEKVRHYDKVHE